jgi:HNH endonuclease
MESPTTFNALLRDVGIDPNDVCLLRHTTAKPNQDGLTLFEFRERDPQGFETYLRTQERGRPMFIKSRYWANFVVTADGRTMFVGLYQVEGSEPEQPGSISAFDGEQAGARNGKDYDLYNARRCAELTPLIDVLEIKWPPQNARSWATYACSVDWPVKMEPLTFVDQFSLTNAPEGEVQRRETTSIGFVRDSRVRIVALQRANGACEHCGEAGFTMKDGRIYLETHHVVSLAAGGADHVNNVIVLCPNHHREAHYGTEAEQLLEKFKKLRKGHSTG